MKKIIAGVGMASLCGFAFGQTAPSNPSSVELYGVIDAAVRSSSNDTVGGDHYTGLSQGLFNGSRFGLRGTEGLGDGLSAIFDFEGGVVVPTGSLDQQGQVFGRQSWVGLKGDFGQLTVGRQYGTFSDAVGVGDVFGLYHGNETYNNGKGNYGSNAAENGFIYQEMGYRWDNSIKYEVSSSGFTFGAMTSMGSVAGNSTANSMYAMRFGYANGPVSASIGFQTEKDMADHHHKNVGIGAKYDLGNKNGLYAFYFRSKFDAGFTPINATNSELTPGNVDRTDNIAHFGANYYVTPSVNLIGAYFYDSAKNVAAAGDSGKRNGLIGVADYYFSPRSDAYFALAYTKFNDAFSNFKNGGDAVIPDNTGPIGTGTSNGAFDNVSTIMVGFRHRF